MTIKELAHSAQQHLQSTSDKSFKRTHVYELIGAAFGFGSYAALGFVAVLTTPKYPPERNSIDTSAIQCRCLELGYDLNEAERTSTELAAFLTSRNICAIGIDRLIDRLRDVPIYEDDKTKSPNSLDSFGSEWYAPESLTSQLLLECLEVMANRKIAKAHYALALISSRDEYGDEGKHPVSTVWSSHGKR